jgi:transposase
MPTLAMGEALYKRWHFWATHSRLQPVKQVAAIIRRHLPGVLSYFTHRIYSASAFGFRSFDNFRVAILFHCGNLQLHP